MALSLLLVGCAADRPDPITRDDYGRGFARSVSWAEDETMLSACAAAGVTRAERAITDWIAVVARIDTCRVGAARYYTDPEFEGELVARLNDIAAIDGSDACRSQTRIAAGHIRRIDRTIQAFVRRAPELCGLPDEAASVARAQQDIADHINRMNADIRRFHSLR